MSQRCVPLFKQVVWTLMLGGLCVDMAMAASAHCALLGPLPAVLEVAQGTQQALDSPSASPALPWAIRPLRTSMPTATTPFADRRRPRHHQPDGLDRVFQQTAPKHGVRQR